MPRVDYLERYADLLPVLEAMSPAARAGVERLAEILQRDGVGVRTPVFATVAERDEAVSFLVQLADEAIDVEPRYWRRIAARALMAAQCMGEAGIVAGDT